MNSVKQWEESKFLVQRSVCECFLLLFAQNCQSSGLFEKQHRGEVVLTLQVP